MDPLISQIAKNFKETLQCGDVEAAGKAMESIVFSGLSRGGFFRDCFYLPELSHQMKDRFCACFLFPGRKEDLQTDGYIRFLCDELQAMGIMEQPEKTGSGFVIRTNAGTEGAVPVSFEVFIYSKDVKDLEKKICYVQTPLPYEMRTAGPLKEAIRAEIRKAFEKNIKSKTAAVKKKRSAGTAQAEENKKAEPPKEGWVQPSLF